MASKIPTWLDNFIFRDLQGEYRQVTRGDTSADINLFNDENANKRYIGTYFPRSLVECFTIFCELYDHNMIKESLDNKNGLKILDIGTGTGGNVIGLMFFLKKIGFTGKSVDIFTIEGNKIAIDYQRKFVSRFNKEYGTEFNLYSSEIRFTSAKTFKSQLSEYLLRHTGKFNIITSFKFFSEFYNANFEISQGLYTSFTDFISNYIEKNGIILILDILNPNTGRTYPFTTQIMSNELNAYLKTSTAKLNYIIPVCCAKWNSKCHTNHCYIERKFEASHSKKPNDTSKVCYRVLVSKEFSNQILSTLPDRKQYKITHTNPQFCENTTVYRLTENVNIADGFKLN